MPCSKNGPDIVFPPDICLSSFMDGASKTISRIEGNVDGYDLKTLPVFCSMHTDSIERGAFFAPFSDLLTKYLQNRQKCGHICRKFFEIAYERQTHYPTLDRRPVKYWRPHNALLRRLYRPAWRSTRIPPCRIWRNSHLRRRPHGHRLCL